MTKSAILLCTLSACSLIACSSQSPVAPGVVAVPGSLDAKSPRGVPGIYDLTFYAGVNGTYQEVSSLKVGAINAMILKARVTDLSGNPATTGTVTFEYCSYGEPTNDITNPDEAPKEACEQGAATWAALGRAMRVADASARCYFLPGASACEGFSIVRIPRTIGFRFRYTQQGNSIASGTSPARNFEWTAQLP
jgi:hypothetical protein